MDKKDIIFGLVIAVILAVLFSPFASPWPDGLEKIAEDKGFIEKGEVEAAVTSPAPDYLWPGIKSEKIATSLAGAAGTLAVFAMTYALAKLLRKRKA